MDISIENTLLIELQDFWYSHLFVKNLKCKKARLA